MLVTCLALLAPAALPSTASAVTVRHGAHYGSRIFPDDAFTVRDSRQVTGRRVNFRKGLDYPTVKGRVRPRCGKTDYSICDAFTELNKLDGFDLQPRVVEGQVVPRHCVGTSFTFDHRVLDGEGAARFMSALKRYIEQPLELLLRLR